MGPSCDWMNEVRDSDPNLALKCRRCGSQFDLELLAERTTCPRCSGLLDIVGTRVWEPRGRGLRRYESMVPIGRRGIAVASTVGETPIEEMELSGRKVVLKYEHLNPSGSFKDRGVVVALSVALSSERRVIKEIAEDSSGNTAIAVAMLARRLGLRATLFVPKDAPTGKIRLLKLFGARVVECETRSRATEEALRYVSSMEGVYYVDHLRNPAFIEGPRTIAYEVYETVGEVGSVIVPIGSGGLILGLINGWMDLVELGLAKSIPKFVGVQGVEVAPVYERFYGKTLPKGTLGSSRLADGIRVVNPPRLEQIVNLLKRVKGEVVLVNDSEIVSALRELVDMGIVVEPTSASVLAALKKALKQGIELPEPVLLVLTGSGMKLVDELVRIVEANQRAF